MIASRSSRLGMQRLSRRLARISPLLWIYQIPWTICTYQILQPSPLFQFVHLLSPGVILDNGCFNSAKLRLLCHLSWFQPYCRQQTQLKLLLLSIIASFQNYSTQFVNLNLNSPFIRKLKLCYRFGSDQIAHQMANYLWFLAHAPYTFEIGLLWSLYRLR